MKNFKQIITIITLTILISYSINGNAQKSNPYNSFGIKVVNYTSLILKDYNEGKIKDINKETLDYYSKKFNLESISVDFASTIVKKVKEENLIDVISNSKYSTFTKTSITDALNLNITEFDNLIDKINSKKLNQNEKEFLLKTVSMIYNFKINNDAQNTNRFICAEFPGACGAAIGSIFGAAIGGPPGMFIGALIGGLVGSTSK